MCLCSRYRIEETVSHSGNELTPIPLADDFFRRHKLLYKIVPGGKYQFEGKNRVMKVYGDWHCRIDDCDYGPITSEHEIVWLLNTVCGLHVSSYDNYESPHPRENIKEAELQEQN